MLNSFSVFLDTLSSAEMRANPTAYQDQIGNVFESNVESLSRIDNKTKKVAAQELINNAKMLMDYAPGQFDKTWATNTISYLNGMKKMFPVFIIGTIVGLSAWALSGNTSPKA